uniref:Uncharacterized protein n=1 Tax=Rhizophora mucronata TaxID=61149 RepID=A0A2P2PM35_RHIMU
MLSSLNISPIYGSFSVAYLLQNPDWFHSKATNVFLREPVQVLLTGSFILGRYSLSAAVTESGCSIIKNS